MENPLLKFVYRALDIPPGTSGDVVNAKHAPEFSTLLPAIPTIPCDSQMRTEYTECFVDLCWWCIAVAYVTAAAVAPRFHWYRRENFNDHQTDLSARRPPNVLIHYDSFRGRCLWGVVMLLLLVGGDVRWCIALGTRFRRSPAQEFSTWLAWKVYVWFVCGMWCGIIWSWFRREKLRFLFFYSANA